ncbi:MAG: hypothetical protein IJJ47_05395 [Methanosphaera sp.]|nr:hypothetical protein [Methanosphaera sp.]
MASPILAAILSLIIPGLGQFYAGSFMRAIFFFIFAIVCLIVVGMIFTDWIFYIINIFISLYIAYDAYKFAQINNYH